MILTSLPIENVLPIVGRAAPVPITAREDAMLDFVGTIVDAAVMGFAATR